MFPIIPFILLWVRLAHFRKLTIAQLPRATEDDLRLMRKASTTAFYIMLAFTILSFVPYGFVDRGDQMQVAGGVSLAVAVIGLLIAAVFDFKAERIKKRCRAQAVADGTQFPESGAIRWYHVLVCCIPYVGLPWGIVNLVKKRRSSGLLMTIVSGILLLTGIVIIIAASIHAK